MAELETSRRVGNAQADWSKSIAINLASMMRTCRAWKPAMVTRGGGSIINVASVASSIRGVPSRFAYSVTKAGVIGLTKSVAADFVTHGIRCNANSSAKTWHESPPCHR